MTRSVVVPVIAVALAACIVLAQDAAEVRVEVLAEKAAVLRAGTAQKAAEAKTAAEVEAVAKGGCSGSSECEVKKEDACKADYACAWAEAAGQASPLTAEELAAKKLAEQALSLAQKEVDDALADGDQERIDAAENDLNEGKADLEAVLGKAGSGSGSGTGSGSDSGTDSGNGSGSASGSGSGSDQAALPDLTDYSTSSAVYTVGSAITPNTPSLTGTPTTRCVSDTTLPAGLDIDATTCIITGTPTAAVAQATYTITATNGDGADATPFALTITVNAADSSAKPDCTFFNKLTAACKCGDHECAIDQFCYDGTCNVAAKVKGECSAQDADCQNSGCCKNGQTCGVTVREDRVYACQAACGVSGCIDLTSSLNSKEPCAKTGKDCSDQLCCELPTDKCFVWKQQPVVAKCRDTCAKPGCVDVNAGTPDEQAKAVLLDDGYANAQGLADAGVALYDGMATV